MGKLIWFADSTMVDLDDTNSVSTKEFCESPIVIERKGRKSVSVAFHTAYFTIPLMECALRELGYGEGSIWRLKKYDEQKEPYVAYALVLKRDFGYNTDDVLDAIVGRITKTAHLNELRVYGRDVHVIDLIKPYKHGLFDGTYISQKTKDILITAGIENGWDLDGLTREEICQIPGMVTDEVVRLERSLAVRGLFLNTKVPRV